MSTHAYLVRSNNRLVSHCDCETAYMTFPPQMDCPWCGCGWLFTCINCRKAFTFAKAIETSESWAELARRDIRGQIGPDPDEEYVSQWVAAMQEITADVEPGKEYVCFDGVLVRADAASLQYTGWHASHDLDFVPQVQALGEPSILEDILGNIDYWQRNAISDSQAPA